VPLPFSRSPVSQVPVMRSFFSGSIHARSLLVKGDNIMQAKSTESYEIS
jgi:hypothetical protein